VRAKRKAAEKRRQPSELREVPAAEQPLTEQQMEATAAELAACQGNLARPQPCTLLLAQEPSYPAK
jgi:hypothetical protein